MKTAALVAALAPAAAFAQDAAALGSLVTALQGAGLTQLVQVANTLNGTAVGQQALRNLTSGSPFVVFAPNNAAFSQAPSNITGDPNVLADVISYHIVPGNFSQASTHYPNVTLGQTLYSNPQTVHLEGNKPQVVAWAVRDDGKTHVLNQRNDSTVVNVTTAGNLTIYVVDHVLNVPENFQDTIPTNNNSLSAFETLLRSQQLSFFNATTNQTSDITFFDAFNEGYRGFTLFSPNNTAVEAAQNDIQSLSSNRTAINNVLFNHFINGTTLYSPLLAGSQNYTTTAGETLSFSINSTGQFVTLNNITAQIVQPDVLLPNGVVHIIDRVFTDTSSDSSAASSALSSATSAATASQASQTAPIGFSQTQSLSPTASGSGSNGNGSGSGNSNNAAVGLGLTSEKVFGMFVAVVGVMLGGALTAF